VGLLNIDGYFDGLLAWMAHATAEGFVRSRSEQLLYVFDNPDALLDMMRLHAAPQGDWLGSARG
jgi:hypothetical protein